MRSYFKENLDLEYHGVFAEQFPIGSLDNNIFLLLTEIIYLPKEHKYFPNVKMPIIIVDPMSQTYIFNAYNKKQMIKYVKKEKKYNQYLILSNTENLVKILDQIMGICKNHYLVQLQFWLS